MAWCSLARGVVGVWGIINRRAQGIAKRTGIPFFSTLSVRIPTHHERDNARLWVVFMLYHGHNIDGEALARAFFPFVFLFWRSSVAE